MTRVDDGAAPTAPGARDRIPVSADWLVGGGEMGERIRAFDWAATPLGAVEGWPQSLRSAISILLPSKAQICLFWGPDLITIYNDAYRPALGRKHPGALGTPARECWSEVWEIIRPLLGDVMRTGEAFQAHDYPFLLERHGWAEETYFDISYDPVRVESGGVGGVFCIVSETTGRVLGERRLQTLRELGARTAETKSASEVSEEAARVLSGNPLDIPFALLYLLDASGTSCVLAGASGLDTEAVAREIGLGGEGAGAGQTLAGVLRDGRAAEAAVETFVAGPLPSARHSLVLPIRSGISVAGVLVAGVSRVLTLAGHYRHFLDLVAAQISSAVTTARAREEERRRAEALAELDRAKTAFFSNVSHEFRTPLTLMLGPVADALADSERVLAPEHRERLEAAQRNGLRLLKLVNTLLDFSRIEAGRVQAVYEATDVGAFTAELASTFRSAIERAGLRLVVDCPPLPEPVYVDREMWEKIVLNLLSNAFKFTFEGEITVRLFAAADGGVLEVADTGIGIDHADLPHLFERFHRVRGARSRSHEGTGIGLALVQELVRLHGGAIQVASAPGKGTTFSVSVPFGTAHLPADRIGRERTPAPTAHGTAYVEEALRWLPDDIQEEASPPAGAPVSTPGARVLLVDDNADLRDYLRRLLSRHWTVEAFADGATALTAARERPPDLVLTDVMMPGLDGFELLRALRGDARTRTVPVIVLSARAGEESRVEGLDAGADDYLVKPFSARELIARVNAHLEMTRTRREVERTLEDSERRFRMLANVAPAIVWTAAPDGTITFASDRWFEYTGISREENPRNWPQVLHPDDVERCATAWTRALDDGVEYEIEVRNRRHDGEYRWFITRAVPVRDRLGRIEAWFGSTTDIHDRKAIEVERERLLAEHRRQREFLESVVANAPIAIAVLRGRELRYTLVNPTYQSIVGPGVTVLGRTFREVFPEAAERGVEEGFHQVLRTGRRWPVRALETPIPGRTGMTWWDGEVLRVPGAPDSLLVLTWEITDHKRAEAAMRQAKQAAEAASRAKDEFLAMLGHELRNPLGAISGAVNVLGMRAAADGESARPREIIRRQTAHLTRLLDDLLDVTRLDTGKIELQRRRLDLRPVVERALGSLAESGRAGEHEISLTGEPLWVDGDPTRLEQVVFNLLDNAVKYTPPGGRVAITMEPEADQAVLRVADTGMGMAPEVLPRVFEPFVQADPTLDRSRGGLGLGLTLVKRLVELHGGAVSVRSPGPGRGTEVLVRLPLAAPHAEREVAPPSEPDAGPRRVLVIEDNQDIRDSLRMVLELGGHHVDEAADGVSGLDLLLSCRPDVAFIDLGLPGRDGYQLARAVRAAPRGEELYLVALSGYGQPEDRRRAFEAGFDVYLVKPVEPDELVRVLAKTPAGR